MRRSARRVLSLVILATVVCAGSGRTPGVGVGSPGPAAMIAPRPAARARDTISLLRPGSLHGDEVPADAAGDWLALVPEGDHVLLWPVTVSVVPERDMIVDEEGEVTGKRVELSPPLDPIVLVRGLPPFSGQLTTLMLQQAVEVGEEGVRADLHGVSTRLVVRCADAPPVSGQRQQGCTLSAQSGMRQQALFTYVAYSEGSARVWATGGPTVLWAGDLDLDGSLDLLLDTSNHENVMEMRLFLSSAATAGELVSEVARFTTLGC